MNRMIAWFAQNSVAANLLMTFLAVSGLMAGFAVKQEVFPEFSLDRISIQLPYLGAAPEEVERAVNARIEDAIQGIDGIKEITSTASEGMGSVMVELELGADARKVVDDVKSNVDAIKTFPEQTEEPIIRELTTRQQVIDIAISGETSEFALKTLAERVRDELTAIPQITQADVISARPYEISIEVSENDLKRHGLTFEAVANAVRQSSLDLPGGSVRSEGGEILLRTVGEASRGEEFASLVLLTRPDGSMLHLGDVATIVDGFAETDQFGRFDGKPAIIVSVFRTGDQSALEIAAVVKDYVDRAQLTFPDGVSLTVWQDQAKVLDDRLSLLLRNGLTGFALVFLVLALFLDLRLAFWVSLGIPISFLGAIMLMPGLGVSVNVISLFAFILVLGIVVDDAIIVGEMIFSRQEEHGDGLRGSIEGAQAIHTPVIFAVLTTVAAFMPLMFVPGTMGKIFAVIPLIVIPCLLFSLVEVTEHSAGSSLTHIQPAAARAVEAIPELVCRRPESIDCQGISAEPRVLPAVALSDGGGRGVDPRSDRRDGLGWMGQLSVLSVSRGRLYGRGRDAPTGLAALGDVSGSPEARAGCGTSTAAGPCGDWSGRLSPPARYHRRAADGSAGGWPARTAETSRALPIWAK